MLLHPNVGFDNYAFGNDMFQWCIDYAKKNWTDSNVNNTGGMFLGYSVVPVLELRHKGAKDNWAKNGYKPANFYFVDGVGGGGANPMNAQVGYDLSSATMAAHPEIKYWVACGFFDDYSDGIARAADAAGKSNNVISSTAGGTGLINHWDAGETGGAWKSAIFTDQRLYAEPIFNGLYAMMSGKATAETLWPQWINRSKGDKYASLVLRRQRSPWICTRITCPSSTSIRASSCMRSTDHEPDDVSHDAACTRLLQRARVTQPIQITRTKRARDAMSRAFSSGCRKNLSVY